MKKLILALCLLGGFNWLSAQTMPKYHRVLISGDNKLAKQLWDLGITIDHGHALKDGIETEISEDEIRMLDEKRIPYKILISDMTSFYQKRNEAATAQKTSSGGMCNEPSVATPTNFQLGSVGGYFTLSEMENMIDAMALMYPNLVKAKQPISSTKSYENRDIWYVKISDNPNVDENEPEVLYTAVHHAREAASLSQLIFYMWYLLENYATDPDIQATLNNTELFFVPCLNPDGYVYNQTIAPNGGGMWRRNRRLNSDATYGVDLNRNYGHNWGFDNFGSSPSTASDVYRGTGPFSEPETQAMQNFCNSRQFTGALNAHTFGNFLIYPWGFVPSFYTPDSTTFANWGTLLTRDSRFRHGTGDQTVGYITNGNSDDWMYGEQTSKPKIFAMTPESGTFNDGFWPASNRIIDICKTTFSQNYNLARLAGNYAVATDEQDKFISGSGYIKYKLQRLGMASGTFTVNITPIGGSFSSTGQAKVYSSLSLNQAVHDSIPFVIGVGLTHGQKIKYAISVNNGSIVRHDTVTKIYGTPAILFYDNGGLASSNFDMTGFWGTTSNSYVSPPLCITESPGTDYSPDDHKTITTKNQVSLANAVYAHLQYYTRFDIEKTFDAAEVLISTNNGGTYVPLCGKYESSPVTFGGTDPVYDGIQADWVKEDIDLSDYIGMNVKIRFSFNSDFYTERDGFYFDDLLIRKIGGNVGLNNNLRLSNDFVLSPNPSSGRFSFHNPQQLHVELRFFNSLGQMVLEKNIEGSIDQEINLNDCPGGIYFVRLKSADEESVNKLIIAK